MRTTVLLAMLVASLALPAGAGSAVRPTVSVSPGTVVRGHTLLVTGRHWTPGARVELLIGPPYSEADHVAWTRAGKGGTLRRRLTIPHSASTGRFVLLACRRACRVKASASFRIVAR